MNKKELIEKIEALPTEDYKYNPWIDKKKVLGLVRQLDESQKVKIPQIVADWIKAAEPIYSLSGAMVYGSPGVNKWLESWENQETFARAWLDDGYTVEEKLYMVKVKGHINENILVYGYGIKKYFFSSNIKGNRRAEHTRKQLEEAGFGEVFNSTLFEVEEVTE